MSRFATSWRLVKASAAVLRSDKELIIFPLVSGLATLIVLAFFAVPLFLTGAARQASEVQSLGVVGWVVLFAFYLAMNCVVNYFNAALVGTALMRLRGQDPTANDGFRIASQHFGAIFGYSLIAATIGVILMIIRDRAEGLGRIIAGLGGMAWNIATFLAIPVLVVEDVSPLEAVKRSAALLKRTWGEQLIGGAGIGLVFGLIAVGVVALCVALFVLAAQTQSLALMILVGAVTLVLLALVSVISGAFKGVYIAALYHFAADGTTDNSFFAPDLVQQAFVQRRS